MRSHENHRARCVTSLSLQPLESRTPLAANVTTVATPVAKLVQTAAVELSTVRVQAIAVAGVTVENTAVVAAAQTATAAAEAGRAAAVVAASGKAPADIAGAAQASLDEFTQRFGETTGGGGRELPGSSLKDPAALLAGRQTSLTAFQEKYGIAHGSPAGSPEDARAAGAAGKGMAAEGNADEGMTEKERQERIEHETCLSKAAWEKVILLQKQREEDIPIPGSDPQLYDAYQKEIDAMADLHFEHETHIRRLKNTPPSSPETPAPDDIGTAPHRASPPLSSPPPRPASATRPVVDGGVTVQRTPVVVHGTMPTNPAVDRGRDYQAPHRGPVEISFARLGTAINWGNQR